ncbi:MAG: HAMP domain-containing protein, partial [Ktedonobacteraceae bacterium]
MFLKSKKYQICSALAPLERRSAHSLRLRLIFLYGGLLALGLSCFALLVLALVKDAINTNMQNMIGAQTSMATNKLNHVLHPLPPYWPPQLKIEALDTYQSPGLTIEVFTLQGQSLYASDNTITLGLDRSVTQDLMRSTRPVWYNTNVGGDWVQVEASAIYPPPTSMTPGGHMPMIGVLLVAKSLHDTDNTLMLFQGLLLLTGMIILILFLGCGWAIVGYALRPLSALVKTSSSIAATLTRSGHGGNLSQRVQRPAGDDELAQVVDAFNEMLTSIESSTTVQRRFIADASHE